MADDPTVERRDLDWGQAAGWFSQHVVDLDPLTPHELDGADTWAVTDPSGSIVGMAVVEPNHPAELDDDEQVAWVHRIGVRFERQEEGFGRLLLERIRDEYGTLELEIDQRETANGFYDALGLDIISERYAVMNDGTEGTMRVWRWE